MSRGESLGEKTAVRVALEVTAGPHRGARFEFERHDTFLVGRGTWSHLCLQDDLHFSRHHFRIEIRPPDCYLIDLGSRNGTFVNGNRISAAFLRNGDVISGGKTEIRVTVANAIPRVDSNTPTILAGVISTATRRPVTSSIGGLTAGPTPNLGNAADAGQGVPGYELLEELGGGAMGVVYRALHKATGETVAIKLINRRQSVSEQAIQLFVREASLLGRLNHPHIVRCLDFGYSTGQLYLVMEYVPTIPLQTVMEDQLRSAQIRIACGIISQLLKALEHTHRMSVVHRDIKPENVLLWRKGRKLNAKLADFGLAKNYAYAGLSEISREGDIRGTIAYMPPELVVDCRDARPAGDIYSVGATLYHYLTNEFPFDFGKRNKLVVVLEEQPVPLRERSPDVPDELAAIVHRAIEKEPGNRFASARKMLTALAPFASRRQRRR